MARKKSPGLIKRGSVWHIQKKVYGKRLCESTGTGDLEEAERYLARRIEDVRQAVIYGVRPERTFREAATKFLLESVKRSLIDDAQQLKLLDHYVGDMPLDKIHLGSLQKFIVDRRKEGVKTRTINKGLQITRHILNLATQKWRDENGLTWLQVAPKIELLPEKDKTPPYPLSWAEQAALLKELPAHLVRMVLFKVNTGCRDHEVCNLRWEWEVKVPELNTCVFLIPGKFVKNGEDRLVVLNDVAKSVVEEARGEHPEYVFTYKGRAIDRIHNSAWRKARIRAGLPNLRVHDLKHTFGRRLRAAGVSFEDRQDLLGHRSKRITTHYSAAELQNLLDAANKVCNSEGRAPTLVLIKRRKVA